MPPDKRIFINFSLCLHFFGFCIQDQHITPETCAQAKESLKTAYNVKNSDRKPTIIQPRLKIHNLDPQLTQYDKKELRNKIVSKNEALENATDDEFMITFIDKKQYFAIAKVSPDVHKKLTNNGRVYIEL